MLSSQLKEEIPVVFSSLNSASILKSVDIARVAKTLTIDQFLESERRRGVSLYVRDGARTSARSHMIWRLHQVDSYNLELDSPYSYRGNLQDTVDQRLVPYTGTCIPAQTRDGEEKFRQRPSIQRHHPSHRHIPAQLQFHFTMASKSVYTRLRPQLFSTSTIPDFLLPAYASRPHHRVSRTFSTSPSSSSRIGSAPLSIPDGVDIRILDPPQKNPSQVTRTEAPKIVEIQGPLGKPPLSTSSPPPKRPKPPPPHAQI